MTNTDQSNNTHPDLDNYLRESLSSDLRKLRALTGALLGKSEDEIRALIESADEKRQSDVIQALSASSDLALATFETIRDEHLASFENEEQRKPLSSEPQRIHPDRVLVLTKKSMVELDMLKKDLSEEELFKTYEDLQMEPEKKFSSHEAQLKAREILLDIVGEQNFHFFWDLSEEDRVSFIRDGDFDAVIALGGDDTAKAIAPYVDDKFFMLLNSDHLFSKAALSSHKYDTYKNAFEALSNGEFLVEEWARLEAEIEIPLENGSAKKVLTVPAINEIGILDQHGKLTFRGNLEQEGYNGTQAKATGLLISTGAGSTGWYNSATEAIYPYGRKWPRTEQKAEYIIREPYRYDLITEPKSAEEFFSPKAGTLPLNPGVITPGEELVITSTSKNQPFLTIDCTQDYDFPYGSVARIRLSKVGLKFLVPQLA